MTADASTFDAELRSLLTDAFGATSPQDGFDAAAVEAAERRLSSSLPLELACLYRRAGRHPALTQALQNLVPLDELLLRRLSAKEGPFDGLVFLTERQGVCAYAIAPIGAGAQPRVWQTNADLDSAWFDCSSLPTFLLRTICWNAMEINVSGVATLAPDIVAKAQSAFRAMSFDDADYDLHAYRRGGTIIVTFPAQTISGHLDVHVSAPTDEDLQAFDDEFGFGLAWN